MTSPRMNPRHQYLLDYLEEEFRRNPEIRVRVVPQEHEDGVLVRTESREYFFPFEWADEPGWPRVHAEVRKIREILQ